MIEDVLAELDPKIRKHFLDAAAVTTERIESPSVGLNLALGGGFGVGREHTLYGNKSSGKSSLMLQTIGKAQSQGLTCAYFDVERTFDPDWARSMGVDPTQLILSTDTSLTHVINSMVSLLTTGRVDLIVLDSLSALVPAVYFEDKATELKPFENTGQIGSVSRDLSNGLRMVNYANTNTAIVFISQTRTNIGGLYATQTFTGGNAVKFYSSAIIKLFSSESDNKALKAKIPTGDRLLELPVGREVDWFIEFSKISAPGQRGQYPFYYRGDRLGVDTVGELVRLGDSVGLFQRSGAWYDLPSNNGHTGKVQGLGNLIEWYRDEPDEQQKLMAEIRGVLS